MLGKMCLSLFFVSLIVGTYANIANIVRPCPPNDRECLVATTQSLIPQLAGGFPQYGIPAADPMTFGNNITIDTAFFQLTLIDTSVVGPRRCQAVDVRRNLQESTIKLTLDCPFNATGRYALTGSFLYYEVNDQGPFEIQTDKIRTTTTNKIGTFIGPDGKKHWSIVASEYTYEPLEKFNIKFGNLFQGDILKAQPVMDLLSSNWREYVLTLGKPIVQNMVEHFVYNVNEFFHRVPVEELDYQRYY